MPDSRTHDHYDSITEAITYSDSMISEPTTSPQSLVYVWSSPSTDEIRPTIEVDLPTDTPRRSLRTTRHPIHLNDFVVDAQVPKEANFSQKSTTPKTKEVREPRMIRKAVLGPSWVTAMEEEMGALARNHTWELVPPSITMWSAIVGSSF